MPIGHKSHVQKEARVSTRQEEAIALGLAGLIVIILGAILLGATPVSSDNRWWVALICPTGGVIMLWALARWLDATFRPRGNGN